MFSTFILFDTQDLVIRRRVPINKKKKKKKGKFGNPVEGQEWEK